MRKIIVTTMITLDGVMQAPGGPQEDPSGDFKYGGWTTPYRDPVGGKIVKKQMEPADYLLGRKTFENFASFWPKHPEIWPGINEGNKYVLTNTLKESDWKNTHFIKGLEDIKTLKNPEGCDLQVWGSGELVQLLLQNDLVDELWLRIYPLTLGKGKKLFDGGTIPTALELVECLATPTGVIVANYRRDGEVRTGRIGE